MNAIRLLTDQHRKLESLLKATLAARQPTARATALARVGDELVKHLTSEEKVFYPAVKMKRTEGILLESLEEHLSLKRLLADLLALDPAAETWEAKFKVLNEQAEHHHKEEEEHLFPEVRNVLNAGELDALGERLLALQQNLQSQGDPREAVTEQTDEAARLK
jgi:hemerythrin superfamily protein